MSSADGRRQGTNTLTATHAKKFARMAEPVKGGGAEELAAHARAQDAPSRLATPTHEAISARHAGSLTLPARRPTQGTLILPRMTTSQSPDGLGGQGRTNPTKVRRKSRRNATALWHDIERSTRPVPKTATTPLGPGELFPPLTGRRSPTDQAQRTLTKHNSARHAAGMRCCHTPRSTPDLRTACA